VSEISDGGNGVAASGVTVEEINAFLVAEFAGSGNFCESLGERWAVARLDTAAVSLRPGGIISGPTVFGVCDAALYYACFTVMGIEPMVLTSEMSIRFMRPARGPILRARADLHHAGRRSLIGTVVAWTDDPAKPVAAAQGTYVAPLQQ
jgi:acyl-coenzyme A thioesterase PaaI-like protein